MLKKAFDCLFCATIGFDQDSEKQPVSFVDLSLKSRDVYVRIVHPGGREEFYECALPASVLMDKYPGSVLAKPQVFKNPHESLLWPDELLVPGHKYLLIPSTTAQKLKRRHEKRVRPGSYDASKQELLEANITWDDTSSDLSDNSVCWAKDFYAPNNNVTQSKFFARKTLRVNKSFVPPLPRAPTFRTPGWEPSLTSVQEVSP